MQKFNLTVTQKNGKKKNVKVYLDDTTAELLKQTGDQKLIEAYLLEVYEESRKTRQASFWNRSLEADLEKGIDYEDKHPYGDFSFEDFEDERLQMAIEQLEPRQQDILQLVYIEGKTTKEVGDKYGVSQSAISHALERIYASIQKNYRKK